MVKLFVAVFVCLLACLLCQVTYASDTSARAYALRKGVEQERLKVDCFSIRYTEHRAETNQTAEHVVDFDRGKIRREILPSDDSFVCIKSIFLGDCMYVKHGMKPNDSVGLCDPTSAHAYGADTYDPRLLGIAAVQNHTTDIGSCLSLSTAREFNVEKTMLSDKEVYRVFYQGKNAVHGYEERWEFFIEETGFRILKILVEYPYGLETVESEYTNPKFFPFPTKIRIVRKEGKPNEEKIVVWDRTFTVTDVKFKKSFPPETFTLASLNLQLNTTVSDHRIKRRLGYWDGEKLVNDFVHQSAQEQRKSLKPRNLMTAQIVLISAGLVLLICGIAFAIFKRLKKGRNVE
jgi:hypothetical protein